jgi:protein SCO1/2
MRSRGLLLLFLMLLPTIAFGHGTMATSATVDVQEKLGNVIPADIVMHDDNGKAVNLRKMIDRPTIIAPVYLHCMHVCPMLLNGLATALGQMELMQPGRDYKVITLSFDDHDTPAFAREKKPNYIKAVGKPFPAQDWSFLTGDEADIRRFTDSIGFTFQRDGEHDFSHPVVLVVLAPGGKVVRYLYGTSFLPFAVTMALTEAARGEVGSPAQRVLQYCFSYDPLQHSYVFNILKVTGTVMVLFVGGFLVFLLKTSKRRNAA